MIKAHPTRRKRRKQITKVHYNFLVCLFPVFFSCVRYQVQMRWAIFTRFPPPWKPPPPYYSSSRAHIEYIQNPYGIYRFLMSFLERCLNAHRRWPFSHCHLVLVLLALHIFTALACLVIRHQRHLYWPLYPHFIDILLKSDNHWFLYYHHNNTDFFFIFHIISSPLLSLSSSIGFISTSDSFIAIILSIYI